MLSFSVFGVGFTLSLVKETQYQLVLNSITKLKLLKYVYFVNIKEPHRSVSRQMFRSYCFINVIEVVTMKYTNPLPPGTATSADFRSSLNISAELSTEITTPLHKENISLQMSAWLETELVYSADILKTKV